MKQSVRANSQRFLEIVAENIEDFHAFLLPAGQDEYHRPLAGDLVSEFSLTEQYRELTVILMAECLKEHQDTFLDKLTQKKPMQSLPLFQDAKTKIIRRDLQNIGHDCRSAGAQRVPAASASPPSPLRPIRPGPATLQQVDENQRKEKRRQRRICRGLKIVFSVILDSNKTGIPGGEAVNVRCRIWI